MIPLLKFSKYIIIFVYLFMYKSFIDFTNIFKIYCKNFKNNFFEIIRKKSESYYWDFFNFTLKLLLNEFLVLLINMWIKIISFSDTIKN